MSSKKSQVSRLGLLKGKSCSSSVPSFSIRYNAEDDEVEQLDMSTKSEEASDNGSPVSPEITDEKKTKDSPIISKLNKRAGSLEEVPPGEPWRRFTEFTGRITKTVEEKLEEIKSSDRLKVKKSKEDKSKPKLTSNSSVSDSEEKSEASSSFPTSSSPEKSVSEKTPQDLTLGDTDAGDVSDSLGTPDRATTPIVTEMDASDSTPLKEVQSIGYNKKSVFFNQGTETDQVQPKQSKGIWRRFKKPKTSISVEPEVGEEAIEECRVEPISLSEPFKREEETKPILVLNKVNASKKAFLKVISWWPAVLPCLLAVIYKIFDIAPLWFGVLIGMLIGFEIVYFYLEFQRSLMSGEDGLSFGTFCSSLPKEQCLHSVFTDSMFLPPTSNPEQIIYEGWVNEFATEYQPENYHVTLTETVYVTLQGSVMKLSTPRQKIPKRAFWSEPRYKLRFNRERLYNISNCSVSLLPEGLTHKRIWSKKYPICIQLQPHSHLGVRYREKGQNTVLESTAISLDAAENDKSVLKVYIGISDSGRAEDLSQESIEEEKPCDLKETGSDSPLPTTSKCDPPALVFEDDDDEEDPSLDFVKIPSAIVNKSNLYLFARTDREKDIWFRRLVAATTLTDPNEPLIEEEKETPQESEVGPKTAKEVRAEIEVCYMEFMKFVGQITQQKQSRKSVATSPKPPKRKAKKYITPSKTSQWSTVTDSVVPLHPAASRKSVSKMKKEKSKGKSPPRMSTSKTASPEEQMSNSLKRRRSSGNLEAEIIIEKVENMWVNSFIGRILFDTLKDPYWVKKIQDKIQRKISTIKIPTFMEELIVSNLEFSDNIPLLTNSQTPVINEHGLWIDLGVKYTGTFKMTIDTKLNLMKLKKVTGVTPNAKSDEGGSSQETSAGNESGTKSAIFDSSMEDSAESSSGDPPDINDLNQRTPLVANSGPKVLKMVDKIAASRYFQQVTDNKYVKRALEGVSNTNISLLVEVKGMDGTLVLNFPPPPSDRLWYGFRPKTKLLLSAQPKWGTHAVTVLNIASWIERKLCREFEKFLVIPNMDDLVIPLMTREHPM